MQFLSDIPPAALFFAAVGAVVVIGGILVNLRWALAAFAIMVFASSISYSVNPFTDELITTLFTPIQLYRNFIYMFGGGLCYLAIAAHLGQFNRTSLNANGLFLIAIATYAAMIRMLMGYFEVGLLSLALAVFSIVPLVLVLPNLIQRRDQIHMLMRWVLLAMGIWIIMNTIQFLVNPAVLYPSQSGRFQGLTGNPQFAAVLTAFATVMTAWVALNDPSKVVRLFAIATATALGICIVWTGSRTGFGMVVVGMSIILASRAGQAVLFLPIVGAFALFFLQYVIGSDATIDASRLVSTQNTRAGSWQAQISTFLANPLFGTGNPNEAGASENSYLLSFSAFGVFMGALVLTFAAVSGAFVLRLFRNRRREDKLGKAMTDLAIAGIVMYFAGAFFEGFIMARVHSATTFLIIAGTIGHRLLDTTHERHGAATATALEHDAYEHEDEHHPPVVPADEHVYLPEDDAHPRENVWAPEDDWAEHYDDQRVSN
ncbi:MAG: hypothetical protein Tsb0013_20730 [Phycisphaerales bacterium]